MGSSGLQLLFISIPAFREEGDSRINQKLESMDISIPAFREEGDLSRNTLTFQKEQFQSPPSVRKATVRRSLGCVGSLGFQSPPSVRKATDGVAIDAQQWPISIPAFREEGDKRVVYL